MSMTLRDITAADAAAGHALTQQAGWPHRPEDWQQLIALGEGVVMEEAGRLSGCALGWRWGSSAATIGLVVVDQQARGRGIGRKLMQALITRFAGCTLRLHATEMGKGLYAQLGFRECGQVWQYQTAALAAPPAIALPPALSLEPACSAACAELCTSDWQATGLQRARLLQQLLPGSVLARDAQGIQGFASLRRFGRGWTIGPVIARDGSVAQALVATLLQTLTGQFVRLDTPDAGLAEWLATLGLQQVDAPHIMVHGTPWRPTEEMHCFALVSPALG